MSCENPLVSVIVPVYNVEIYLSRCIDSILNQTYGNLQVLLIDDGSPDRCPVICDEYASKDSRIEVIHKKNGGLSDARNAGLNISKGEYIVFVDSDDYIDSRYVETMIRAALESSASLVMCNFEYVSDTGCAIEWQPGYGFGSLNGKVASDDAMTAFSDPLGGVYVVSWNKLYQRNLFDDIRFPEGKIHEDQFVIHCILAKSEFIFCIPDRLYYYTQREKSIMSEGYSIKHLDVMDAFLDRAHFYLSMNKYRLVSLAYKRYINELAKAYCLIDRKDSENRKILKLYYRYLKNDWKTILFHTNPAIIMRFATVMCCPSLYYSIIQHPQRK